MKRCLNCGKVVNGNTKSCYFCGSLDLIYEEDNTNNLNNEDNGKTFIFVSLLLGFLF